MKKYLYYKKHQNKKINKFKTLKIRLINYRNIKNLINLNMNKTYNLINNLFKIKNRNQINYNNPNKLNKKIFKVNNIVMNLHILMKILYKNN